MARIHRIKNTEIEAIMISTETLEIAERWCNGSIKGTKLPRNERVVEFWCPYRETEMIAQQGDYIVKLANGAFDVYPRALFQYLFEDIDDTPF